MTGCLTQEEEFNYDIKFLIVNLSKHINDVVFSLEGEKNVW